MKFPWTYTFYFILILSKNMHVQWCSFFLRFPFISDANSIFFIRSFYPFFSIRVIPYAVNIVLLLNAIRLNRCDAMWVRLTLKIMHVVVAVDACKEFFHSHNLIRIFSLCTHSLEREMKINWVMNPIHDDEIRPKTFNIFLYVEHGKWIFSL